MDHLERIYLAKDKNVAIKMLYLELKRKSERFSKSLWVIMTIDTTTIPSHQRFFEAPNCTYGIYTLASTSPTAIEDLEELIVYLPKTVLQYYFTTILKFTGDICQKKRN